LRHEKPRDISGEDLIKLVKPYGYIASRQTGSYIRLSTEQNGQHHITLPRPDPLKIGPFASILSDIASHFKITKQELFKELFG
jgi:predicted RNA binding protein YcfA (HicA-like mRNA interferase family)